MYLLENRIYGHLVFAILARKEEFHILLKKRTVCEFWVNYFALPGLWIVVASWLDLYHDIIASDQTVGIPLALQ